MAELGLNEHHQNEVINYMRFARFKRGQCLKTVDSCFQDLKDSRLVEETFTVDEVIDMLDGLRTVVHSEVESELINTTYTNVLLLRQLFSQAEKWYLKLQTDVSELENRELLEQVAEFEKSEFTSSNKKPSADLIKPKLAPLNEGGSELLNKTVARLQEENEKLKTRLKTIETQATTALDEKSKLEKSLKDLQMIQGDQKDITELENKVAALKCQFEKTLNDSTANQKFLEENLVTTKHDLLKVQDQLSTAEKELEKKFQQTAAYRNMKEILTKKNELIKDLRKKLSKYEPED
ncbi:PREDICTED: leucine zipper transcription factor-like protein 1 isoform X2 [Calidris pugnax]|uniref:leucine zipper transcription factor-like protein 1 isoform X2 n=1 Tax=Calidris pugnax TaxID=198806 RepID=UPI00071C5D02|nr:PREDICTED: leucine zipper transcription factor-like protein 1 isoform X2 [Calidris pugnax]